MGKEKQALDDAMRRWEKMDERYRLRIQRQIKAMDRLLNANRIMLAALQTIDSGKPGGKSYRHVAKQAIEEAQAVLVVPEDEQEETTG